MEIDIDIISFSDTQYLELTDEQILEVQKAQVKKNRLAIKLEKALQKEKHRLVDNGMFSSSIWETVQWELNAEYEMEVENIRSALLFYLYLTTRQDGDADSSGYVVDYTWPIDTRVEAVQAYYEDNYEDALERFEAFEADMVARRYLGEGYLPLYDYFLELTYEYE